MAGSLLVSCVRRIRSHSITLGSGPSEGLEAGAPAINLDAIAGRALLAMPQRLTHRSGCACEGCVRDDRVGGGHHLVQTA